MRFLSLLPLLAVAFALTGCGEPRSILRKDPADMLVNTDHVQVQDGTNAVVLDCQRVYFVLNGEDRIRSIGLLSVKAGSRAQADQFHQALATALASKRRVTDSAVFSKDGEWIDTLHWTGKTEPSLSVVPAEAMMAAPAWKSYGDFPGDGTSATTREFGQWAQIGMTQDDEWLSNLQRETGGHAFLCADLTTGMHTLWIPYNLLRIAADKRNVKTNPNAMNAPIHLRGITGDPAQAAKVLAAYLNGYLNGEKAPEK